MADSQTSTASTNPLKRVSPDADLTGKTYCVLRQGAWLNAGNGSPEIYSNPHSFSLDFTSAKEVTITERFDPYSKIVLPDYIKESRFARLTQPGWRVAYGSEIPANQPRGFTIFGAGDTQAPRPVVAARLFAGLLR